MSRQVYPGGYNACLVLAAYFYDCERTSKCWGTPGQLARGGARRWPSDEIALLSAWALRARIAELER